MGPDDRLFVRDTVVLHDDGGATRLAPVSPSCWLAATHLGGRPGLVFYSACIVRGASFIRRRHDVVLL